MAFRGDMLISYFYHEQDLLEDPCPTVRATAIHGVCRITGIFWELIPAHIIKTFITTLVRANRVFCTADGN